MYMQSRNIIYIYVLWNITCYRPNGIMLLKARQLLLLFEKWVYVSVDKLNVKGANIFSFNFIQYLLNRLVLDMNLNIRKDNS